MTILVTGATGFVGAAVARALLEQGRKVRVLVRATSARANLASLPLEIVEGDLRRPEDIRQAVQNCDGIYHVAADYRLWARHPEEIYQSNVDGTRHVMEAAVAEGVPRVVYTSSVAALGLDPGGAPADETTPVRQADLIGDYKKSKFQAQEVVRQFAAGGLSVVIVNPSTPVGPGDIKPTPTGDMVLQAARGKMTGYVDTGLNIVHVNDVARGHLQAFEKGRPGECYILGGQNLTLREILLIISGLTGGPGPKFRVPHGLVLPIAYGAETFARLTGKAPFVTVSGVRLSRKRMFFKSDKAETELGYSARTAKDALSDAIHWFQDQGLAPKRPS